MTGHWMRWWDASHWRRRFSACAETSLQDTFGVGKVVPDATQVPTNQGVDDCRPICSCAPRGQHPRQARSPPFRAPAMPKRSRPTYPPPSGQPLALETAQEAGVAPPPAPEPVQQASQSADGRRHQRRAARRPGRNRRHLRPLRHLQDQSDGTPKSPGQMREELRQKQIAKSRRRTLVRHDLQHRLDLERPVVARGAFALTEISVVIRQPTCHVPAHDPPERQHCVRARFSKP